MKEYIGHGWYLLRMCRSSANQLLCSHNSEISPKITTFWDFVWYTFISCDHASASMTFIAFSYENFIHYDTKPSKKKSREYMQTWPCMMTRSWLEFNSPISSEPRSRKNTHGPSLSTVYHEKHWKYIVWKPDDTRLNMINQVDQLCMSNRVTIRFYGWTKTLKQFFPAHMSHSYTTVGKFEKLDFQKGWGKFDVWQNHKNSWIPTIKSTILAI